MKVQIRQGVFETNSSSLHSLTVIPIDKWDKWGKGELLMDVCFYKCIKPCKWGNIDGQKIHDKYWKTISKKGE